MAIPIERDKLAAAPKQGRAIVMLEPEIAALRDALLNVVNVTNSENQATRWAYKIYESMYSAGYMIERIDHNQNT